MIVPCRKCGTKFRFAEGLITAEGVWLRCSRCRAVFFQEPIPQAAEATPPPLAPGAAADDAVVLPAPVEASGEAARDLAVSPESSEEIAPAPGEEIQYDLSREEEYSADHLPSLDKDEGAGGEEYTPEPVKKRRRSRVGTFFIYLLLFIVILGASGFGYYQLYPDQARELLVQAGRQVPWVARYLGLQAPGVPLSHSVQFIEIKQRFLHNFILGSLRVVDGKIVNSGPHPLTRLKVKGELYNAQGQILGERTVYSGNILTDEDLAHKTEEEIMKILNRPEGMAFMNDRIPPGGQIPFMLIFIRENQGAEKTLVRLAGGETLVP